MRRILFKDVAVLDKSIHKKMVFALQNEQPLLAFQLNWFEHTFSQVAFSARNREAYYGLFLVGSSLGTGCS
jgi:hypothetical protein